MKSFVVFLLLATAAVAFAGEPAGDVVIIYDQSSSMRKHDPSLVAKLWIALFLKTYKNPFRVALIGFDEKTREYIRVSSTDKNFLVLLSKQLAGLTLSGPATDFEPAMRYLSEYDANVSMAVIFTDGRPELWNETAGYLSQRVRSDDRYKDLNDRYIALELEGLSSQQLYERLNLSYEKRNLELIDKRLIELKQKYGQKLVFADVANESNFLREWSEKTGATLFSALSGDNLKPIQRLRDVFVALRAKVEREIVRPAVPGKTVQSKSVESAKPVADKQRSFGSYVLLLTILVAALVLVAGVVFITLRRGEKQ